MSADEIFAAQMWTWPGPMVKRAADGRVLIVNAAFLQMYGGAVENWHGNAITGWPVPATNGAVTRFETRLPTQSGTETVYDWVESTLTDGNSLALARDVTIYAHAPVPETDTSTQDPAAQDPQIDPAIAQAATAHQAQAPVSETVGSLIPDPAHQAETQPAHTPATDGNAALAPEAEPIQAEPASESPETPPASDDASSISELIEPVQTQTVDETVSVDPNVGAVALAGAGAATLAGAAAVAGAALDNTSPDPAHMTTDHAPQPSVAETQSAQEKERSYERRALPIQGDAVLGNNWRDAVIAKAVGVEDTPEPAQSDQTAKSDTESASESPSEGVTILLAEDNAINALLTRTLLEAEGCIVEVVEDGSLAVQAMKKNKYDMIFMDMRMPNMDGLEATRKIRAMDHRSKGLPIVALTANAFDDDRNACFDSGMNDFMTKPVSAEELSQMVKTHTAKKDEAA